MRPHRASHEQGGFHGGEITLLDVPAAGSSVPVIDIADVDESSAIDLACRESGFFAIRGDDDMSQHRLRVIAAAQRLFQLPDDAKQRVSLAVGGTAWRGWFPLEGELTSGVPDLKEGFYVGREQPPSAVPLHGPNVWPVEVPELQAEVLGWTERMEALGQRVLASMAVGLGLDASFFQQSLTNDPTVLFRIFRYPAHPAHAPDRWGVAEHSDYGLLTLLAHDGTPGLQVKVGNSWVDVDADPTLIVCNIGDMLDRLTAGRYRSTPHRVRNAGGADRISLPFFLDPGWTASVEPLALDGAWTTPADRAERWDRTDLTAVSGPYGTWLLDKVRRVFPTLADAVLDGTPPPM
jgi:isopenicillin N synthase-like dioxygenase